MDELTACTASSPMTDVVIVATTVAGGADRTSAAAVATVSPTEATDSRGMVDVPGNTISAI